ncbi:large ribosomal subunit protein eL13-like [Convolutriloba macropyga]|uniref:large ribosomal subunit protein eL13-like n=1 Tax=Convolutriloba macropyga TaxID=536237 RepID=UPI003F527EF3
MKHNNQLASVHLRKHWQRRVKTWFDQPARKWRRHMNRVKKAKKMGLKPAQGTLKPAVSCPTRRYNFKLREGRGFTRAELFAAGLTPQYARAIGIAVDPRRKNKSQENLDRNKERLKEYLAHVTVIPLDKEKREKKGVSFEGHVQYKGKIMPISNKGVAEKPRLVTDEEKKFVAYQAIRRARADARLFGRREKKRKEKEEASKN